MNWPVTTQHTVWWDQTSNTNSMDCNASGFSHMHLSWHVPDLSGSESVPIYISATIFSEGGGRWSFAVQQLVLTETKTPMGALTIPVPSEIFSFFLWFQSGTTASVKFAFYLTYA